eukprot:UN11091
MDEKDLNNHFKKCLKKIQKKGRSTSNLPLSFLANFAVIIFKNANKNMYKTSPMYGWHITKNVLEITKKYDTLNLSTIGEIKSSH